MQEEHSSNEIHKQHKKNKNSRLVSFLYMNWTINKVQVANHHNMQHVKHIKISSTHIQDSRIVFLQWLHQNPMHKANKNQPQACTKTRPRVIQIERKRSHPYLPAIFSSEVDSRADFSLILCY